MEIEMAIGMLIKIEIEMEIGIETDKLNIVWNGNGNSKET
jgi:hypothetical protein